MLGKIIKRAAKSAAALTLAFEAALLNMPDLVSSPVEEYMEDNGIPLELIDGVRTDNIRVYDDHSHLSALHLASFLIWENAKNMDLVQAYIEPFMALPYMYGNMASIHAAYGECMIYMPDPNRSIEELVSIASGIPKDDLELSQKFIDTFRTNILLHEIGHAQPQVINEKGYCERSRVPKHKKSAQDFKNVLSLLDELRSDDFSLDLMSDKDVSDYVIALRAVSIAFYYAGDMSHDTAIYLDEWYRKKIFNSRNELPDHKKNMEQLTSMLTPYLENYSSEKVKSYKVFKAMLDFLDDEEVVGQAPYFSRRVAELLVEGLEYLAPTKASELRMNRSHQKILNEDVPSV